MGPIGYIADDITGATDLASALATAGLDVRLAFGSAPLPVDGADAIVVALKIRSIPAAEAAAAARTAAAALRAAGAHQLFFKYCSTFDSTAEGNIGPIADALLGATGASRVVHCPAYPANGRTVYLGHLFVGDELLSDSPMRDHPLNPMRDSRLGHVLSEQTPHDVELVTLPTVEAGPDAVAARLAAAAGSGGVQHVIADAVRDSHLTTIAQSVAGDPLAAGGAAFGAAFAIATREHGGIVPAGARQQTTVPPGPAAILAGSLSQATRAQVRIFDGATLALTVDELVDGDAAVSRARDFARQEIADGPLLITTEHDRSESPDPIGGRTAAERSRRIELAMGRIGQLLVELGVRRLVVAGGETSGAVADALALHSARIGPEISTGVPWIVDDDRGLAIAFKSGNFGGLTFFRDALDVAGP